MHPATTHVRAADAGTRRRRWRRLLTATALTVLAVAANATAHPALAAAGDAHAAAPAAPVRLEVPTLAVDDTTITLAWHKPDSYADIVDYHVYRDGTLIGRAGDVQGSQARPLVSAFYADASNREQVRVVPHHFIVRNLAPDTTYRFTVRSVNSFGVESADSPAVTRSTTATPPVFDITAYGALGDGTTLNTQQIQAAIDAVTPGGKLLVPAGVFKTGAIWLKSDMTLEIAKGATLLGSENAADYPFHRRLFPYSTDERYHGLINAQSYTPGALRNIRIVGEGLIDGNGWLKKGVDSDGFRVAMPSNSGTVLTNGVLAKAQVQAATAMGIKAPYPTRSDLVIMRGVQNAFYGGFTMTNPANHGLVNINAQNVTVQSIRVETFSDTSSSSGNNADGIEFINSTGLKVYDSVIDSGDDGVNLNAGIGAESTDDTPTSDVWVFDNYIRNCHGAIVAGSFTGAWIQDVLAEDNVITIGDVALRMKTAPPNGGGGRRVLFRDTAVKNVAQQAFIFTSAYADNNASIVVEPAAVKARFEEVTVQNVTVDGTGAAAIGVIGVPDQYHQKLRFSDVRFINAKPTSITYLKSSWFSDVTFDNTPNPWVITNSTNLRFLGATTRSAVSDDAATAPSRPGHPTLEVTSADTSAVLVWTAATDPTAVNRYQVLVDGDVVATVPGAQLTYAATGLSPAQRHRFAVQALDATGNVTGGPSASATTTGVPDTTAPVPPAGPAAVSAPVTGLGITWARINWVAASDDVAVDRYAVFVNGKRAATVRAGSTSTVLTGLTPDTAYTVTVRASDAADNVVSYPTPVSFTTLPAVVVAPLPH